jgi:hypothetical protein
VLLAADGREPPNWVSALTDGDSATLNRLVQALRDYFEVAAAPHWPVIRAQVDADRDQRTRWHGPPRHQPRLATRNPA